MPVRLIRYTANRPGLIELLNSADVEAVLLERGERVAAAAKGTYAEHLPHTGRVEVTVHTESDSDRQRVAVVARHPAAGALEAKYRVLGGSLGAAR